MTIREGASPHAEPGEWTFLTNHAHVLICIATDPEIRLRDVATSVGITERAAQRIVMELEQGGFLERERVGRRNRYRLHIDQRLRHPLDRAHRVSELLDLLSHERPQDQATPTKKPTKKGSTSQARR